MKQRYQKIEIEQPHRKTRQEANLEEPQVAENWDIYFKRNDNNNNNNDNNIDNINKINKKRY